MMIEKPTIDRERLLREERRQHALARCIERAQDLLAPDERLGVPARRGTEVVVPILKRAAAPCPGSPSTN